MDKYNYKNGMDFDEYKKDQEQRVDLAASIPEGEDEAGVAIRNAKVAEVLGITTKQVNIARDMILIGLLRKSKKLSDTEKCFFWSINFCPEGLGCSEFDVLTKSLYPVLVGFERTDHPTGQNDLEFEESLRFENFKDDHVLLMDEVCSIPAARHDAEQVVRNTKISELLKITTEEVETARRMVLNALKRTPKELNYEEKIFIWGIHFCPDGINCTDQQMLENNLYPVFVGFVDGVATRIK